MCFLSELFQTFCGFFPNITEIFSILSLLLSCFYQILKCNTDSSLLSLNFLFLNFPSLLALIDKTNYVNLFLVSIRFCRPFQGYKGIFKLCLAVCRNQGSIVQLYPLFCLHFSQNISQILKYEQKFACFHSLKWIYLCRLNLYL